MRNLIDNTIYILLFLMMVLLSGCASKADLMKSDFIPVPSVTSPSPSPGTIWAGENGRNMLFADKKARYVNDIVTIIISESSTADNTATTNTGRTGSATAGITSLLGVDKGLIDSNKNLSPKIEIGGSSTNTLKGTGNTSRAGKLQARVTARVVQVLDNGNLVVEGKRQLSVNEEDQYIIISGIIRPEDITADNLIASQHIADARIIYTGEGVINDKMRPGWLTRALDWVWPF
ncbi:MAG: flagellar basal body L-ring protein FlgH [Smithellaceae bacterium]|nr:flagellar basal body L-ring protein FlgH [Smithellaceae bacterium]